MNKLRIWLSSLLVLQVVVAAGLFLNSQSNQSGFDPQALLDFDQAALGKVVIAGDDGEVSVVKSDGNWVLSELDQLPANTVKIDAALEKLADLKATWPVTTTAGSHERFEVAEKEFQRKVQLYAGEKLVAELYLGSSPGFRQVHVRADGDDNVYALALNTYDFPVAASDWLDKGLLAAGEIKAIKGKDYALAKELDHWSLSRPGESEQAVELNAGKAEDLARALSTFAISGVADESVEFPSAETVVIDVAGPRPLRYTFLENDNKYYVRRDDIDSTFTLSAYDYERIAGISQADLTVAEGVEATGAESLVDKYTDGILDTGAEQG